MKMKLLIVDDEPATRISLAYIFESLGHQVRTAADGFSALLEMRCGLPHVLLSDLNMPGMSGFELLSVVRRRFPAIHVIAMSGHFSGEGIQPGVAADAFYEKGSGLHTLLETVRMIAEMQAGWCVTGRSSVIPVWLPIETCRMPSEPFVTLVCSECLRTFPAVPGQTSRLVQEAACVYCSNVVAYAVMQATDPRLPQEFQRKSLAEPAGARLQ